MIENNSSDYFHLKLIELGRVSKICEVYEFFNINPYGLGRIGRKQLIDHYLYEYRNFDKNEIWYECVTTNVEEYIVNNVSQGIPVLVAVAYVDGGHALIVYDYDETTGKLYGHMGWDSSLTHVDLSSMGYLYIKNAATIRINMNHSHSDNYVDVYGNSYCSCYFSCHPEHEHSYAATADGSYHTYSCNCRLTETPNFEHSLYICETNENGHKYKCGDCNYESELIEHDMRLSTYISSTQHGYKCHDCGYIDESTVGTHSYHTLTVHSYSMTRINCRKYNNLNVSYQ